MFETATVDVNILLYVKEKNTFNTLACIVKDKELKELRIFINRKLYGQALEKHLTQLFQKTRFYWIQTISLQ